MEEEDIEFCGNCMNDTFRIVWTKKGYVSECAKCGWRINVFEEMIGKLEKTQT